MLFIDEACRLNVDSEKDYGKEALDTLMEAMLEGNRVMIFVGYPKEMEMFMQLNPGFKCQIRSIFHLHDYTSNSWPRPYRPHSRLQIDLIDMAPRKRPFLTSNRLNFRYIVSVKCCFSKFCWLIPIQTKNADDIYSVLYILFQRESCPDILQSDNGSEFIANIIGKVCHDFGVRVVHGRPHHPQSQGQIEKQNKVTKKHAHYLQNLSPKTQAACWPMLLPFVADVINNTPSPTTNDIPFRLYKNREPKSFIHYIVPEEQIVKISVEEKMEENGMFSKNDLKVEVLEPDNKNELVHSVGVLSASSITQSHRKICNMGGVPS